MTPKQTGFFMPAEWTAHQQCWMAWPRHAQTWQHIGLSRARHAYLDVALAISQFEHVSMLVHPEDFQAARERCPSSIQCLPLAIDDSWTRDTGPTFLLNQNQELAAVNWIHNAWGGNYPDCKLDNQIATALIDKTGAHGFNAPLVMEGGSFQVDGEGTILTTKECLLNSNRNPHLSQNDIEHHLCDFLGGQKVIWLQHGLVDDETDGHIDEVATFIAPGEVLALITENKNDENYDRLQNNLSVLQSATDAKGRTLKVHTVEMPPPTYLNNQRLTLSYINFYFANQGIVMPAFNHADYDKAAHDLFIKLFPYHKITQINALDVFAGGGGIHCITQQQPSSKSQ